VMRASGDRSTRRGPTVERADVLARGADIPVDRAGKLLAA
jgi:hypothetical protein